MLPHLTNNNSSLVYELLSQINSSRKVRLSEEIFIILRNAIIDGTLPSGYSFPNENDMCKMLDIGRSTLREAYSSLEILNLITRTKNGTVVNGESAIKNMMNFDIVAENSNPRDVIEFREIIEVGIVYNAAMNATAEDIERLEGIVEKQKENSDNIDLLTVLDFEFHSELAKISGNQLLYIAFNTVRIRYEKFAHEVFSKRPQYTIQEHMDIIDALRGNDCKLAKKAMRHHLKNIRKVILDNEEKRA